MSNEKYHFGDIQGPVQTGDGVQFTAGGAQYVAGRDQVLRAGADREVLDELAALREALMQLRLTSTERTDAERDLAAVEDAVKRGEGDHTKANQHLESFTAGLRQAGALASAGTSLAESIAKVARWLGPLGVAVLALL